MRLCTCGALAAVSGAMCLLPIEANASGILSFSFSDLSADFAPGGPGGLFDAEGSNTGTIQTAGDVTRLIAPGGTALFGPGLTPGDIAVSLVVSGIGVNTATGTGTFLIRDADGDTLSGNITGMFSAMFGGGGTFFNGAMFNVQFMEGPGVPDANFNGLAGGAFDKNLGGTGIYNGFVINLFINPTGNFFQTAFSDVSSQFSGILVPVPGPVAVLGLGLAVIARRRR
jgi:hypothetical protein